MRSKTRRVKSGIPKRELPIKQSKPIPNSKSATPFHLNPAFRLLLVWGVLIAGCLGLAVNLYRLQIIQGQLLTQRAKQQQSIDLRPFVPRRPIVDRNGNVLASDRPAYTLYAHPKLFKISKQELATELAPILNVPVQNLIKQFDRGKSGLRIANDLTEEQAKHINKLRTDGLELLESYSRFYPQEDLAADVVGYVDGEHRGQAGVEYSQQSVLQRAIRNIRVSRAGNGALMPDDIPEAFLHVDDLRLQLTIDSRLQRATRLALKEQMQKFHAKRGTVIVMDARDGSLLTLVSEPTYNPNKYGDFNLSLFKNWAISDLYEPGSTFKPINVAIALELGVIKHDSIFYDGGGISVGGWRIKNAEGGGHGSMSIAEILQYSSNIGMVQIIQRIPPKVYYSWLERLGLGQTTMMDLPFEAKGRLKDFQQFISSPIEPATASFGQGISMTPIQLVQLNAALANGGKLVTPHVIKGLFDSQGQMYWHPRLPEPQTLFSPANTKRVLAMMETVVSKGTGKNAQIPGFKIGGKTGTAQKASPTGGYHSSAKITSFVGILSTDSPRYVVAAIVDEPQGVAYGSTVAAPIVKSVMEALIQIEKIPPSEIPPPSAANNQE